MLFYQCPNLFDLRGNDRVRNLSDAARVFAHRLARKAFGSNGRCLSMRRLSKTGQTSLYEARIGTRKMKQIVHLPISVVRR